MILYSRENIIHETLDNKQDVQLQLSRLYGYWYTYFYHYLRTMLKHRSTSLPTSFPVDPLTSAVIRNDYYYYYYY